MKVSGSSVNWRPRISRKHPNSHEIESNVSEGDKVEFTVISCRSSGMEYDLNIDVALRVESITSDAIKLQKFPGYAKSEFKSEASVPTDKLEYDVHAINKDGGDRIPLDNSPGNETKIYTHCDECGSEAPPGSSYCPNCGERI